MAAMSMLHDTERNEVKTINHIYRKIISKDENHKQCLCYQRHTPSRNFQPSDDIMHYITSHSNETISKDLLKNDD